MAYTKEQAWINKKRREGVSDKELLNCVGMFSDKKKSKVMKEKSLTSKQYDERRKFLFNVYNLLSK